MTDQELVQLNKQSVEYLKYFFEVSEKKTQIYDVTRSTAHIIEKPKSTIGYILNELFGIHSAEGAIPLAIPAIAATSEALTYGTGILLGGIVVNKVVEDYNKYRELLGSWGNDTSYANDVQRYTKLASSTTRDVTITSADYVLANSRGVFDLDNSQDMESLKHIARGIAIERTSQQNSLRTVELPVMDFKVMGRVDPQGYGNIVSAYFDIDPNAGKPKVLSTPIPYQPKSILFTPDDRESHLEWSKLPGFTPSIVKIWQEGFEGYEQDWEDLVVYADDISDPTIKGKIKEQQLPVEGKIRFVPRKDYNPSQVLRKGENHGFIDKFGNEWTKGPSRTPGEPFEWDIQLSPLGQKQLGWASRDGKHINVSLKGKITHK